MVACETTKKKKGGGELNCVSRWSPSSSHDDKSLSTYSWRNKIEHQGKGATGRRKGSGDSETEEEEEEEDEDEYGMEGESAVVSVVGWREGGRGLKRCGEE